MPRLRQVPRSRPTRAQRIRILVDDGVMIGPSHPILADLPEAERAVLVSEAIDLYYAERVACHEQTHAINCGQNVSFQGGIHALRRRSAKDQLLVSSWLIRKTGVE